MARFGKFHNPYVKLAGVNLSADANQLTFVPSRASLPDAAFGDDFNKTRPGIKDYDLGVQFYHDFASSKVHQTLYPLYRDGSDLLMLWKPINDTVATSNPLFSGTIWIQQYPLSGNHADNYMTALTFGLRTDFTEITTP